MGYLTAQEVKRMGFASVGDNVLLSSKASYYHCERIKLGSNVRIDDYCVLSAGIGGITIGSFIHIGVGSTLIGAGKIVLYDFANISSRVAIYSSNDDYSGLCMTNPMVPAEYTGVSHSDVFIGRHVIIGAGSVILPGSILEDGVAVGALSLISSKCAGFGIYAGVPAKRIRERKRDLLLKEEQFRHYRAGAA